MTDSLRPKFQAQHPDFPWLDPADPAGVEKLLRSLGWLTSSETFAGIEKPGEGNMNLTLRVRTSLRTFIIKQARPWVEKYDMIAAPWERIFFEQDFYQRVAEIPGVAARMPRLIACDPAARLIALEDLPGAEDMSTLYGGDPIRDDELQTLADYVALLHAETEGTPATDFTNREMRALNHEHIYKLPLMPENGLDLEAHEPGLRAAADALIADADYVSRVHETGERYLADGNVLLHGDFFPGSWLRTDVGLRVIDPEFCYYGDREFDVACAAAHLVLAGRPDAARKFVELYQTHASELDAEWLARYAACEMMRRLIGVAQLPIAPTAGQRADWLETSKAALLTGDPEKLWS